MFSVAELALVSLRLTNSARFTEIYVPTQPVVALVSRRLTNLARVTEIYVPKCILGAGFTEIYQLGSVTEIYIPKCIYLALVSRRFTNSARVTGTDAPSMCIIDCIQRQRNVSTGTVGC